MDEQGHPESESKKELTEFALLSIGVSFAVARSLLKEKVTGEWLAGGRINGSRFTEYMCTISPRFRAPLDLVVIRGPGEEEPGPDMDEELVLVRYTLDNMEYTTARDVRSGTASAPILSPVFALDTSAEDFVGLLIGSLQMATLNTGSCACSK